MNTITEQKRTPDGNWREIIYDMNRGADIARYIARNPFAFPGGYALAAITDDGGMLCADCCRSEYYLITTSCKGDGWYVIAVDCAANWGEAYNCDNCSKEIQ